MELPSAHFLSLPTQTQIPLSSLNQLAIITRPVTTNPSKILIYTPSCTYKSLDKFTKTVIEYPSYTHIKMIPNAEKLARSRDCFIWADWGNAVGGDCMLSVVCADGRVFIIAYRASVWTVVLDLTRAAMTNFEIEEPVSNLDLEALEATVCKWTTGQGPSFLAVASKNGSITFWEYDMISITFAQSINVNSGWITYIDITDWAPTSTSLESYMSVTGSNGRSSIWKLQWDGSTLTTYEISEITEIGSPRMTCLSFYKPVIPSTAVCVLVGFGGVKVWDSSGIRSCEIPPGQVSGIAWEWGGRGVRLYTVEGGVWGINIMGIVGFHGDIGADVRQGLAVGSGDSEGDGDDVEAAEGKEVSFYGVVGSGNCMVDFVLYSVATKGTFVYVTSPVCHFGVQRMRVLQSGIVSSWVVGEIRRALERDDIFYLTTPARLLWDILDHSINEASSSESYWTNVESMFNLVLLQVHSLLGQAIDEPVITPDGVTEWSDIISPLISSKLLKNPRQNCLKLLSFAFSCVLPSCSIKSQLASSVALNDSEILNTYIQTLIIAFTSYPMTGSWSTEDVEYFKILCKIAGGREVVKNLDENGFAGIEAWYDSSQVIIETCAACGEDVPFTDLERGVCKNEHKWTRCMATFKCLFSPNIKSCLGCNRKIDVLGGCRGSRYGEAVVGGVDLCFYCGSRFRASEWQSRLSNI